MAVVCGIEGTNYSLVIMPRRKQTNRAKALAKMLETATPEQVSKQPCKAVDHVMPFTFCLITCLLLTHSCSSALMLMALARLTLKSSWQCLYVL